MSNFESFSEDLIPRIVPQPTLHPTLDMSKPTVPEVSLIFDGVKPHLSEAQPKSYKEWKQQKQQHHFPQTQQQQHLHQKHQHLEPKLTSIQPHINGKKIVKFNMPPVEVQNDKNGMTQGVESAPMTLCQHLDLSLCEPNKMINTGRQSIPGNYMEERQFKQQNYNDFMPYQNGKMMTMPMAARHSAEDMCNRLPIERASTQAPTHLNSNQNAAPPSPKEVTLNEIYKMLQSLQGNSQSAMVTNNRQYQSKMCPQLNELENQQQMRQLSPPARSGPPPPSIVPYSSNSDPTMRDMLNIILKQQEQLINIQNQVHLLLVRSANMPTNQLDAKVHSANQITDANANSNQIKTHPKPVGVMTSFEINVQNYNSNEIQADPNFNAQNEKKVLAKNQSVKQCGCICNCESRRQSSESGSNDENYDTEPHHGDTQTGWTFYGNILNQVNDVLQNTSPVANTKPREQINSNIACCDNQNGLNGSTDNAASRQNPMPNIRTAQFKQVGFQIDDVNISALSKRITFGSSENPRTSTDKSIIMNALAMKYLPCDLNNSQSPKSSQNAVTHTTPINTARNAAPTTASTPTTPPSTSPIHDHSDNRHNEFDGKNYTTDMSVSSYRYMQKYGLL